MQAYTRPLSSSRAIDDQENAVLLTAKKLVGGQSVVKKALTVAPQQSVKSIRFQSPQDIKSKKSNVEQTPRAKLRDITNQTPGPTQTSIKKSTVKPPLGGGLKSSHVPKSAKPLRVWVDHAATKSTKASTRPQQDTHLKKDSRKIIIPDVPPKDESDFEYMPPKPPARGYVPSEDELLDFSTVFKPPCFLSKKQKETQMRLANPPELYEISSDDLFESLPPLHLRDSSSGLDEFTFDSSALLI